MALTLETWTFHVIILTVVDLSRTEENDATTANIIPSTTEAGGTITIPAWIIYALVFPIIGIAAIIGLVAFCRWIIRKRNGSIVPHNEPENNRIVNEISREGGDNKEVADRFVVSHESKKISKKPKKAVNCLQNRAPVSATTQETHPGIEMLNKAIKSAKEDRENAEANKCDDAISENAFNHMKEEALPNDKTYKQCGSIKPRTESMSNKFKMVNEKEMKSHITRDTTVKDRKTRKKRKSRISALKRNTKLLKSKLNRQITDSSDETTDATFEVSTSIICTESEKESDLDPSIAHSGEEDSITDDEDSGGDHSYLRHTKRRKTRDGKANEPCVPGSKAHKVLTNVKMAKKTRPQHKVWEEPDFQSTTAESKADRASHSHHRQDNNTLRTTHEVKEKETTQEAPTPISRQGPIATSSFKSSGGDRAETQNSKKKESQVHVEKKRSKTSEVAIESTNSTKQNLNDRTEGHARNNRFNENYKQFEEAVQKCGKISLNRSMSLNEVDTYKSDTSSRRRKRKYQSLRQVRKESVFDVLQKLDKTPKKSILKKSKSMYIKTAEKEIIVGSEMPTDIKIGQPVESDGHFATVGNKTEETVNNGDDSEFDQYRNLAELNEQKMSRTRSIYYKRDERNKDFVQRSRTPDPYREWDKNIEKSLTFSKTDEDLNTPRQKRNELFETNTRGFCNFVMSDFSDVRSRENGLTEKSSQPEIVSSNLTAPSNLKPDTAKPGFANERDKTTTETIASSDSTSSFDRFSPISPKQILDTEVVFPEIGTRGRSLKSRTKHGIASPGTDSESNFVNESDTVTFNTDHQAKLRQKLIAHQRKQSKSSEDVEVIEIPIEDPKVTKNTDKFQTKNKGAFEQLDFNKTDKAEININDSEPQHSGQAVKAQEHSKLYKHASIHISERGLVYPTHYEFEQNNNQTPRKTATEQKVIPSEMKIVATDNKEKNLFETTSFQEQDKNQRDQSVKSTSADLFELSKTGLKTPFLIRNKESTGTSNETPNSTLHKMPATVTDTLLTLVPPAKTKEDSKKEKYTERSYDSTNTRDYEEILSRQDKHKGTLDGNDTHILNNELHDSTYLQHERPKSPFFKKTNQFDYSKTSAKSQNEFQNTYAYKTEQKNSFHNSEVFIESATPLNPKRKSSFGETQDMEHHSSVSPYTSTSRSKPTPAVVETVPNTYRDNISDTVATFDNPKRVEIFSKGTALPDIPINVKATDKDWEYIKKANTKSGQHDLNGHRKQQVVEHVKQRSKTPTAEIAQSPKYLSETKRSMTPTPGRMNTKSHFEQPGSFMRTIVDGLNVKHNTPLSPFREKSSELGHIESFSKNFTSVSRNRSGFEYYDSTRNIYRTSLRNKTPKIGAREKGKPNNKTLLSRRQKDENTLAGRDISKKPSERERPKSAMSLRSAPRPTYLETVHVIPKHQKRIVRSKTPNNTPYTIKENAFTGDTRFAQTQASDTQNEPLNTKRGIFVDLPVDRVDIAESDSELEEFFANPDVESLQFNNTEDISKNFAQKCEKTHSAYAHRSKLSKSKSFKV